MAKVLVTGGTGFIGSHLVRRLVADGQDVVVTGCRTENELPNVKLLQCHLNGIDYADLGQVDVCFHLAGDNDTLSTDRSEMYQANVVAPKDLFERLLYQHGCKKIVYASSASVYGNGPTPLRESNVPDPLSVYAESKLAFDMWVLESDLPAIGLRFSNVYGPSESHKKRRASLANQIVKKVQREETIRLFKHGEQKRDWIYVEDVVGLNLICANSETTGIVNCASGQVYTFNDLATTASDVVGKPARVEYIDCFLGAKFQTHTYLCTNKSRGMGFIPSYDLKQGMEKIIEQEDA